MAKSDGVSQRIWLFKLGVSVVLLESFFPLPVCTSHLPPNKVSYEVVIPWQVAPKVGDANRDQVSYVIKAEGKNYVVHLTRKEILVKKFPIITYKQHKWQVGYQETPDNCYYHGYVEGKRDSFVTLSICSGLRGTFQTENGAYNIDPLEGSSLFQHLVHRVEGDETDSETCRLSGKEVLSGVADLAQGQNLRRQEIFHPRKRSKYLELFVRVGASMFKRYNENVSVTVLRVVQLIQMVDDIFLALGLRVLLVGMEIWTEESRAPPIPPSFNDTAAFFNGWQVEKPLPRVEHDVAILLQTHSDGQNTEADGILGSICDEQGVAAFISAKQVTLLHFAIAVAHEIGHVLGMPDDEPKSCCCGPGRKCVMSPQGPYGGNPLFSNCSARSYFDVIRSGKAECLNNVPDDSRLFAMHSCGDGVVDGGEECDCGEGELCKQDRCCREDCTKAEGALCTTELCCKMCRVAPEGMLCREAAGDCDLPEYCTGMTAECPPDVVVQDGSPCSNGGYCYSGICSTHTLLCQKIFGTEARSGPLSCYRAVNSEGDRFGNCGGQAGYGNPTDFKKCDPSSVLCGQVQCVNIHTLPQLDERPTVVQTPGANAVCWGLGRHAERASGMVGAVEDGTRCGKDRVCISGACIPLHSLPLSNASCDPTVHCSARGVCNSNQNCHCLYGWKPPGCDLPGHGGSIDSGPAPRAVHFSKVDLYVGVGVAGAFGLVLSVLSVMVLYVWGRVPANFQSD
ncbi:disintegrin and metalloproteinase domain-containing protein 9-like [Paroedura picta]|uniref:disintegrin and metalloproteinase domain-containing protein 9-like n=1 Tax=Paroedura picta TaxID=143630 RepID=UPI004057CB39